MIDREGRRAARTAAAVVCVLIASVAGIRGADKGPTELQQRVGTYVSGFITSLSNLVGQEDIQLRQKKVTSELLLVRFPGSAVESIAYRDVVTVDGTPLPRRREHLLEMLQKNFESAVGRANQIATDSADYVPPILNPLYAIAFLQPHLRPRFTIDDRSTPPDQQWPRHTKMLTFTETTKPTLLRAGIMREFDVPTRGTAWVDDTTGRVLQTELLIRHPDGVTTIKTTFTMDDRLQVMVPSRMEASKPDARATYTNFRRFIVNIDEAVVAGFR